MVVFVLLPKVPYLLFSAVQDELFLLWVIVVSVCCVFEERKRETHSCNMQRSHSLRRAYAKTIDKRC